jgi:hypothetical protein
MGRVSPHAAVSKELLQSIEMSVRQKIENLIRTLKCSVSVFIETNASVILEELMQILTYSLIVHIGHFFYLFFYNKENSKHKRKIWVKFALHL